MSYGLVIPKHLVREMYFIRERTGVSIRKQIIQAIEAYIDDREMQDIDDRSHLTFKPVDENTARVFNTKTGRFHDLELGVDIVDWETGGESDVIWKHKDTTG